MTTSGAVLGASYFGSTTGSPLVPTAISISLWFSLFLVIAIALAGLIGRRRSWLILQKIRRISLITLSTIILLFSVVVLSAAYWLVPQPHVVKSQPFDKQTDFSLNQKIEIVFDRPVSRSSLTKTISPNVPGVWLFEDPVYATHLYRRLAFYPTTSLSADTEYELKLGDLNNVLNLANPYDWQTTFKTQAVPRIQQVIPTNQQVDVDLNSSINISLTAVNDQVSEFEFVLIPSQPLDVRLQPDNKNYLITPKQPLKPGTTYTVIINRTDLNWDINTGEIRQRGPTHQDYLGSFTTVKSTDQVVTTTKQLEIANVSPHNGWTSVAVNSPVRITFNQALDHKSAEDRFAISPDTPGTLSWDNNTLVFKPIRLVFDTSYAITVKQGVVGSTGTSTTKDFIARFTTESQARKLAVPAYLQQHALSCEVAALRMALSFRHVNVSENELLDKLGVDGTPHQGNIWGDPYEKFVGNVNGHQMVDGYGVYWGPIARLTKDYRQAKDFENWSTNQITQAIIEGNPVIIWVFAGRGRPTSWLTPTGKQIYAVRDEHAVVVVGFVGNAADPQQLVINDPLVGQVYWSRALFERKWGIFQHSGVVVY